MWEARSIPFSQFLRTLASRGTRSNTVHSPARNHQVRKRNKKDLLWFKPQFPKAWDSRTLATLNAGEHAGKASGAGPLSAYPYFSCSSSLHSRPPKLVLLFPRAAIEIIVPTHKREPENLVFHFNPPLPSCTQSQ